MQPCCIAEEALMAESVDALVSNTSGAIRAGSTPAQGTKKGGYIASFFCRKYGACRRAGRIVSLGTSGAIRAGSTPAQGTKKGGLIASFFRK